MMLLLACSEDPYEYDAPECSAGDMQCIGNVSQMCNEYEMWETYQNCAATSRVCSTVDSDCSGFAGIACCK